MPRRRQFLGYLPLALTTSVIVTAALGSRHARAASMLGEQEPGALKLGYKADTAKVDPQKFPAHKPSQTCANCQLYQGDTGSASGGCVLFGDKDVAAKGWCSAWEQG
ncbi:high-potential iron-sulfur protein [Cupriavidus pauculus]|uniref:High-potential iron-sulfur protein n=1 Tax=Cupriavidus pauculus TaxID=82633 RepID=A0A2N5CA92_9BURK|nr:high-potential iron-sulfur protein [Cupriavidus pauculus]PLP99148.1 twin-arginine translocation pathway signal protein [Cupriavidus pauculus]